MIAPYLHAVWSLSDATDVTTGLRWEMTDYDYTNNAPDSATVAPGVTGISYFASQAGQMIFLIFHRSSVSCIAWPIIAASLSIGRAPRVRRKSPIFIACVIATEQSGNAPDVSDALIQKHSTVSRLAIALSIPACHMKRPLSSCRKKIIISAMPADNYVTNGETDHMGVELSLDWMLTRDWSIATQLTYAQHEYAFNRAYNAHRRKPIRRKKSITLTAIWLTARRKLWPIRACVINIMSAHI